MRILWYEPELAPTSMGNRIHVQELAENLSRLGNEVMLFSQLRKWPYETKVVLKPSDGFTKLPRLRLLVPLIYSLFLIYALFLVFSRSIKQPDIVYTRGSPLTSAFVFAKLMRRPLIVEVNGLRRDEYRLSSKGSLPLGIRLYLWAYEREILWSNHIIAVTPGIKRSLEAELGVRSDRITVIPNGANTDLFRPMDTHHARSELGLPDDYRYVCFVGHLTAWQGVENLIRGVPMILGKFPKTQIIIVGDGPMKAELLTLAKDVGVLDKTMFTGNVPYEKVPYYINASDVCVAPFVYARNEKIGLSPLKLYDYLACGKVVVGSDITGISETLRAANAGIVVKPEDPTALAEATIELFQDDKLRKQMGENSRRYVIENHSWASTAEKVLQVCQRAIEAKSEKRIYLNAL